MRKIILEELRKLQDPINIVIHQSDSSITVDIIMDDTKVGEITLEKGDENAYTIIDAEINNDFRGKGFGTLITKTALRDAKDLGCKYSVLQASDMGRNVYNSIGFKEYCKIRHWEYNK